MLSSRLPWRVMPCSCAHHPWCLCSHQCSPASALLGQSSFIAAGAAVRVDSSVRLPGPAAPLIVVLSGGVCLQKPYLIPPEALQAIQMLTPRAHTAQLWGIAGRFSSKPASLLCHRGGSTCLGRGWGAGEGEKLVGLKGEKGRPTADCVNAGINARRLIVI